MQKFTIGKNEAGQRFDKFLAKYLPSAPRSLIYKMLRKKNITLNGKKADGTEILSCDDSVESFFSDETFTKFSEISSSQNNNPPNKSGSINVPKTNNKKNNDNNSLNNKLHITSSDIIYEDDNILLVNKRPGILSQKANNNDYSLNEWLIDYMLESGSITHRQLKTFKPAVCNRLDRNTGGIVVCGKSLHGIQVMTELIRNKDIEKHYLTICHGSFKHEGHIEAYISKDEKINKSIVNNSSKHSADDAKIITEFTTLQKYKSATLLDVNLLTGKSHQIRAQLASFGNPIWGDKKYGSTNNMNTKYQLLHAYKLIFPDASKLPEEMKELANKVFELPMPTYFASIINKLENIE